MKRCVKCNAKKPVSEFYKNRYNRDGRQTWCKACSKKHQIEKGRVSQARYRSTKKGAKRAERFTVYQQFATYGIGKEKVSQDLYQLKVIHILLGRRLRQTAHIGGKRG